MSGRLMASCVSNIRIKNCQNLLTGFSATIENVGDVLGTQCTTIPRIVHRAVCLFMPQLSLYSLRLSTKGWPG